MDYCHENPRNPNYSTSSAHHFTDNMIDPCMDFSELSDYLMLDYGVDHDHQDSSTTSLSVVSSEKAVAAGSSGSSSTGDATSSNTNMKCRKNKMEVGHRVAFKTKSELEVMDDGFKWRKYGKKSVKNSSNPRNYYKCSSGGCNVKKRVERDNKDSSYVITTYEGVHNHESPSVVYCNPMPPAMDPNNIWTLRPSSQSSAST